MRNGILEWEITPTEARTRKLATLPAVGQVILGIAAIIALKDKSWTALAYCLGAILIYALYAAFFKNFKIRDYKIVADGITISKGKKLKTYAWSEFECF